MSHKILCVFATASEAGILSHLKPASSRSGKDDSNEIKTLITGIGSAATAWSMMHWLSLNGNPDLIINAGIAGSYRDDLIPGKAVMPVTERFADSGIEDNDKFFTFFESGLQSEDEEPFRSGLLHADPVYSAKFSSILEPVNAITVSTSTGSELSKNKLILKFNPDIETMEGATFFYICCREKIPFLAVRAISNRVEPRNRKNWNIGLALETLSGKLNEVLIKL